MLENLHVLISVDKVDKFSVVSYPLISKMPGEFLIIHKNKSSFYFLCSNSFDIESICRTFDWYIVSKNRFNNQLVIGIGLTDKEYIDSEAYRLTDKKTLKLWRDILYFIFESDFVCKFSPYDNQFI